MNKKMKSYKKVVPVIKLLFSTTAKKYPFFFVLELLKMIVETAQPFLGIIVTPLLIDELCGSRDLNLIIRYAAILIIGEFVLTIILEAILCKIRKYEERLNNHFTVQLGLHSMNLDFQLTEDKAALDQLQKAKTGMSWYSGGVFGIAEQLFMFIGNALKIGGFVTLIALNAPWLILFIVIYVVINGIINSKGNKIEFEAFNRLSDVNRLFGYFGWNIVDFRYGKDIRLYNAKDMLVNRWNKNADESNATWKWQADSTYKYNRWGVLARIVLTLILYLYIGMLAVKGLISIGIFTQMIETSGALDATLNGIVWNVQEILKRCNYAYEYVLFMDYPEAIVKNNDSVNNSLHRIEFKNVTFAYPGTDRKILDDISVTIEPGEKLSVVGLNGAGKTTFIKLLCRLYDPTEGQILMDGKDIREYDYREYMNQFAPVFQDFKLFGFTLGENILPKDMETRTEDETSKINDMVKTVELNGMLEKLSKGIDTTIFKIFEEDGVEPSGGEQQKMAIARALFRNAPVIILDEPTAALDPIAEYEIYRQFHSLVGDNTAVYISHRLSSCRFCDKIAVFSGGKIAEYGNHDELVKINNGIYREMFEAQAQYYR